MKRRTCRIKHWQQQDNAAQSATSKLQSSMAEKDGRGREEERKSHQWKSCLVKESVPSSVGKELCLGKITRKTI